MSKLAVVKNAPSMGEEMKMVEEILWSLEYFWSLETVVFKLKQWYDLWNSTGFPFSLANIHVLVFMIFIVIRFEEAVSVMFLLF